MPRPPDNYTHAQFESIDSEHAGETVQCIHCRNWTGSVKTLNRKKAHLLNCPQYAQWRAAGNGQDLAPPNKYSRRESGMLGWDDRGDAGDGHGYSSSPYAQAQHIPHGTPMVARGRNLELSKYFDEFWDDSASQKCMRVRCLSCGFVRAKNTTRQVEHLGTCEMFKNSPEGAAAIANGELEMAPGGNRNYTGGTDIWRGGAPNPNLLVSAAPTFNPNRPIATNSRLPPARQAPSLVAHLLNKHADKVNKATQQPFLSHAGCGTLSGSALTSWLVQNGHISRALMSAIGGIIAKVRLPDTGNTRAETSYRALDLLISTITNVRKEIDFIENTKHKYNLKTVPEPPSPMTKAYMDLLASVSSPQAELLEGMVALWATEHAYCASWKYASTFTSTVAPAANYSVPSYLTNSMDPFGSGIASTRPHGDTDNRYITALHDCMIPNWTSRDFSKFVDACRAIVDEIAGKESIGDGKNQLTRCETLYQQTLFLWERIWPEVDGMGEEKGLEDGNTSHSPEPNNNNNSNAAGPSNTNGSGGPGNDKRDAIEIQDDGDEDVNSPYGGTGLGAIAAANQSA